MADDTRTRNDQRWQPYRSPHRARSHHEAHAEAPESPPPAVLEHELVPGNDPGLVTDRAALDALVAELREAGRFAYDAEFIGEHSYEPRFCVIQVATRRRVTLIDALADLDLRPIWELLTDASVEKLVHAGRQDFEPAARLLGEPPRRVFDTQIAAAFAEMDYPLALPKLAEALIGADLGHGTKFSKWNQRPLSPIQLRYAANDVRYLPLMHRILIEKLDALGNTAWAAQACDELSDLSLYRFDAAVVRDRLRGAGALSPQKRNVLLGLIEWRDAEARRRDIPPRTLLKDGLLLELARRPARSVNDFRGRRGIPKSIKQRCAETVAAATDQALRRPVPPDHDPLGPVTDTMRGTVDRLLDLVRRVCTERGVHPAIVTSRKKLTRLVRAHATDRCVDHHPLHAGWRRELLGDALCEVLQNVAPPSR